MTFRTSAKKKGIALKVEELTSPEENFDDEVAFITKGFRKFYKKNGKNFRKKFSSKMSKDSSRRKEVPIEEVICYECKWQCHYASNCANKKYKSKGKNKKAMTTTWDNDTDDEEKESSSNDEDPSHRMVVFVAFTNNCNDESSGESENEESELQEAFGKLFEESSSLEKCVTQLRRENE